MSPTEWKSCHSFDANPRHWYASHPGWVLSLIHCTMLRCSTNTRSDRGTVFASGKFWMVHAGTSTQHWPASNAVFELGEVMSTSSRAPKFGELLVRRPVAAAALVPNSVILFTAGAVAGALGVASAMSEFASPF